MSAAPYAPGPELEAALAELERLDREATNPAPWPAFRLSQLGFIFHEGPGGQTIPSSMENAAVLAAARNATPRLTATIRADRAAMLEVLQTIERAGWCNLCETTLGNGGGDFLHDSNCLLTPILRRLGHE